MKSAGLLFLIAAVLMVALIEAKDNGRLVNSGIADSSTERITTEILESMFEEIRQIRTTLDQRSQNLNVYRTVMLQLSSSQCNLLPMMDLRNHNPTYFLCQTELNWHMAEKSCKNIGMNLAVVDNEIIFRSFVRYLNDFAGQRGITNIGFWIAGTDLGNEGNWYWQSNGILFTWEKWHNKQPDNAGGNEHCLEFRKFPKEHQLFNESLLYGFNDKPCQIQHRFICEFN